MTLDSAQLTPAFTEASPSFQLAVIVAEYAEVLRESYWAQENTLAGVQEEAERIGGLFEGNADVEEFVELTGRAKLVPKGRTAANGERFNRNEQAPCK